MKKNLLLLSLLLVFCLPTVTNATNTDSSKPGSKENETTLAAEGVKTEDSTTATEQTPTKASETDEPAPEKTTPPTEKPKDATNSEELKEVYFYDQKIIRGQKFPLEALKSYLATMNVTFVSFPNGEPDTQTIGHRVAQLTIREGQTEKTVPLNFYVQNDKATLTITNIAYNAETKTISGKVNPAAVYMVEVRDKQNELMGSAYSDKQGNFSFKLDYLKADSNNVTIKAYDDQGNFTELIPYTLVTANKQTTPTAGSKQAEATNKKTLPQTGEQASIILVIAGVLVLAVAGGFYGWKKFHA